MSGNVQEVSLQMAVIKGGVRGDEVPAPALGSRLSSTAEPARITTATLAFGDLRLGLG